MAKEASMATFTVEITPDSSNGTIAHAVGKFSGGSSSYKGQRRMDVAVSGVGTFSALSPETSGGENTFSLDITGLTPGTTYNWSASLYYKNTSGSWVTAGSQFDKSGSLTTKSGTPALPSGYTKLEYIESDNSAWLDTGITMEKTDTATLEAVYSTAGTSDVRYFGANGYMQIAVTSGGYSINGTAKKALGTKDEIKCAYTPNTESLYVNNSLIDTNDWSSYNGVAVKIGLFKMGDASNGWFPGKAANGKLYRAVVTKNGATVRIFTPCKNANGIAGMWDEISSTFFQSASSFAFTAGPEAKPDLTAHKTLVNGTVYTVQGGKCLVNGTAYSIKKGRTLIAGAGEDILLTQPVHIYGVEWDWTNSGPTQGARTDDAVNFGDPSPAVSNGSGSSPFDTLMPWSGMVKETRSGGVEVKEPKYWFKWTKTGKKLKLQIADGYVEGFSVDPVNRDRGDGLGELDYSYIGRYHCASDYKSTTGAAQRVNITRSQARSGIHNLGANFWQMDFAQFWYVNMLFLVEFADWNGERIGRGCSTSGSKMNNGQTDAMVYHTGTTAASRDSYGFTQYRNIEGWWDNVYDWMDGCYYNSNGLNVITNPNNFSDSANGTLVGKPSSGYPSDFTIPTASGLEWAPFPSEANGSVTTYVPDHWVFSGSYSCLRHGGNYYQYRIHGPFYVDCSGASDTSGGIGCRLQERPPKAA